VSTSPKETKAKARDRLAAERAAAAAAKRRRDRTLRIVLVVVVVAVVAAIGFAVVASRSTKTDASAAVPPGVTATKGYPVGTATKPVLDIWEDFQCPNCGGFEAANKARIEALASSGQARVVYHTWNFLDRNNASNPSATQQSSSRAAIAAACAQDQGKFLAMHDQIFANQPAGETTGWTDAQLEQFAKDAGVPDASTFSQCLSSRKYAGFLTQVNAQADTQQVQGTPTFFVNGQLVDYSAGLTGTFSWQKVGDFVIAAVTKAAS
jgi:protein-disulfide isomerase